jgi:hypothetical protein
MRDLLEYARQLSCQPSAAGGHIRFTHSVGALVFTAGTPSDWRSTLNAKAELRRCGHGGLKARTGA